MSVIEAPIAAAEASTIPPTASRTGATNKAPNQLVTTARL